MQRIGFLYFVVKNASKARPTTRDALRRKLLQQVEELEPVPPEQRESMARYLDRLKTSGTRNWYAKAKIPEGYAQHQDILLVDPRLPSSTGRVTEEGAIEFVDEAVDWGLLRAVNYTLTDRGTAFLALWCNAVDQPLLLDARMRHACTFWYVNCDGDALRAIFAMLAVAPHVVTREQIGEAVENTLSAILARERRVPTIDRRRRQRLTQLHKAIVDSKGASSGSGRALYQQATIRGEHPADLGLVAKPVPFKYQYSVSPECPLREINADVDSFLEDRFGGAYSKWLFGESRVSSDVDVWPFFLEAYETLKNPLGYSGYDDTALLAQVIAASNDFWVEIATIKSQISISGGRYRIRLGIGRSGKPEFVKVENV